ncbi:AAA family ATPase [Burkholderia pseudomallei]
MKITRLDVHNFCGVRRVSVDVHEPLVVIGGANGSGKSSLAEAIRIALTGDGARVVKSSEFAKLVTDGSKGSMVYVRVEHDEGRTGRQVTLPDGNVQQEGAMLPAPAYLPFVIDPSRFTRIDADARRMLLFNLLGASTTPDAVEGVLVERGVTREHAAEAASLMRGGFDATLGYATDQAKAARAAWKAVTGEVYGTRKGESWKAPDVEFDGARLQTVLARLESVVPDLEAAQRELGKIEAHQRMAERTLKQVMELRQQIDQAPRIEAKLADDEQALARMDDAYSAAHAVPCPHCGALVTIQGDALGIYSGPALPTEHTRTAEHYTAQAREALAHEIEGARVALKVIENARKTLANTETYELMTAEAVEQASKCAADLRAEADALLAERRELERAQGQALEAEKRTEAAAAYHADVIDWTRIVDLVSPDGIPSELLQGVLGAFNATLRSLAHMSGFMQAAVTPELAITADNRPYGLLSESERWRTDAMIAAAIARYSELRFVMLDRFDVLDAGWRDSTLRWFEHMFQHGIIDSAFIFATLRTKPTEEPGFMQCCWIRRGEAERTEQEATP